MAKAMAIDHGPDGIRVNCVCPGDVMTPMLPDDAAKRGMSWEDYAAGATDRPLGRIGKAEESKFHGLSQAGLQPSGQYRHQQKKVFLKGYFHLNLGIIMILSY